MNKIDNSLANYNMTTEWANKPTSSENRYIVAMQKIISMIRVVFSTIAESVRNFGSGMMHCLIVGPASFIFNRPIEEKRLIEEAPGETVQEIEPAQQLIDPVQIENKTEKKQGMIQKAQALVKAHPTLVKTGCVALALSVIFGGVYWLHISEQAAKYAACMVSKDSAEAIWREKTKLLETAQNHFEQMNLATGCNGGSHWKLCSTANEQLVHAAEKAMANARYYANTALNTWLSTRC